MTGVTMQEIAAFVMELLQRPRWRRLLDDRFFQGTINSVVLSGSLFTCTLTRTGDQAADGNSYACAPGYFPQLGDRVQCVWLDAKGVGLILGPTPLGAGFAGPLKVAEILVGTTAGYPAATPTLSFKAIPQALGRRRHIQIDVQGRSDSAALLQEIGLRFNGDAGANYGYERITATSTISAQESGITGQTSGLHWWMTGNTSLAGASGIAQILVPNYAGAVFKKSARVDFSFFNAAAFLTAGQIDSDVTNIFWNNAAPITQVDLVMLAGNWMVGSLATLTLY